jgi:hypothetical protein
MNITNVINSRIFTGSKSKNFKLNILVDKITNTIF